MEPIDRLVISFFLLTFSPKLLQECHEKIRVLSMEAGAQVKQHGLDNDLVDRIKASEYFRDIRDELSGLLNPATFVGRAPQQVSCSVLKLKCKLFLIIGGKFFEKRSSSWH